MTDRIEIPLNETTERTSHGNHHSESASRRKTRSRHQVLRGNRSTRTQRRAYCLGSRNRLPYRTESASDGCGRRFSKALHSGPFRLISRMTAATMRRSIQLRNQAISGRLFHLRRLASAGFLDVAVGSAQVSPIYVRSKFLAAHSAMSGALDLDAAFGRDWPVVLNPLIDRRWLYTKHARQCSLSTERRARIDKCCFAHNRNYKAAPYIVSIGIA